MVWQHAALLAEVVERSARRVDSLKGWLVRSKPRKTVCVGRAMQQLISRMSRYQKRRRSAAALCFWTRFLLKSVVTTYVVGSRCEACSADSVVLVA